MTARKAGADFIRPAQEPRPERQGLATAEQVPAHTSPAPPALHTGKSILLFPSDHYTESLTNNRRAPTPLPLRVIAGKSQTIRLTTSFSRFGHDSLVRVGRALPDSIGLPTCIHIYVPSTLVSCIPVYARAYTRAIRCALKAPYVPCHLMHRSKRPRWHPTQAPTLERAREKPSASEYCSTFCTSLWYCAATQPFPAMSWGHYHLSAALPI